MIKRQTYSLIIVLTVIILQSCIRSDNKYYPMVIGTTKIDQTGENPVYFALDTGYTLYPKNPDDLAINKLDNNDRVFIQFTDLDQDAAQKELTAKIQNLYNIDTQEIKTTPTVETADALIKASDGINIIEAYMANGFITLKYTYFGGYNNQDHILELYVPETSLENAPEKLQLFLTHDAKGNSNLQPREGIITFPSELISSQANSADKITITAKSIYSGPQETTVYIYKEQ